MELKLTTHAITIRDDKIGKEYKITTLRTAKDIWELIEETEKEVLQDKIYELRDELYADGLNSKE